MDLIKSNDRNNIMQYNRKYQFYIFSLPSSNMLRFASSHFRVVESGSWTSQRWTKEVKNF